MTTAMFAVAITLGGLAPAALSLSVAGKTQRQGTAPSGLVPIDTTTSATAGVMIPDDKQYCMEGPFDYMVNATRKMKAGPVGKLHKTTETLPGTCRDHGFALGGGP